MTKEIKFIPFEFTAIKTVTVNNKDSVGIVTLKNTGTEDVVVSSAWTISNSAFTTSAAVPATIVFGQTFNFGTVYYKDENGQLTEDSTITGIQIGTGLNDNKILISVTKAACLARMERQLDLWNNNRDFKCDMIFRRPCNTTRKVRRLRNRFITNN